MENGNSITLWVGNVFGAGAIISTVVGWAPAIAAIVALVWYVIQIYESATAQHWLAERRARKLAKLRARVLQMEGQQRRALPAPGDL